MAPSDAKLHAAVQRLSHKKGERLETLDSAMVDTVAVRRFRQALGLPADPELGVPMMMIAHLFRADADVQRDERPHETIDTSLDDPVNGGTEITFSRRLRLGETISAERLLADVSLRQGKNGPMAIVVTETRYRDTQNLEVARLRATMIYRRAAE